jgi:signal peptidase I
VDTQIYPPTQAQPTEVGEGGGISPLRIEEHHETYVPEGQALQQQPPLAALTSRIRRIPRRFLRQLFALLIFGLLCVASHFAFSRFVITPVIIQGRSMMPTLLDGEYYFLNRLAYFFKSPARGDVVVIRDPGHDDFAVKRIIAKPGDWLNLKDGDVYLNGRRLAEPYLPKGTYTGTPDSGEKWIELGKEHYFVMGDNRICSEDSRNYGRITRSSILGSIRK